MRALLLASCIIAVALAQGTFPAKLYGYVPINSTYDSAMFYALRGDDTVTPEVRATRPLVIWLQGGPGASSLFGDYLENGPTKLEATGANSWKLVNRTHTWVRHANMLYIDNPVGTGFSYTKDPRGFSTTDDEIAVNLVTFMKGFLNTRPEFQKKDLWIFCESYGGKMVAYFGAALLKAVNTGEVPINFKGVTLGDGWVDPVACMYSYGPYLKAFSQLTDNEVANITAYAQYAQDALERGDGDQATNWWGQQQNQIGVFTAGINWYNSLYYYDYTADNQFTTFAGTQLQAELSGLLPPGVSYNAQGDDVFTYMSGSFMNDGVHQVLEMLVGGISVNVYGGQVDLIVDTLCIQDWMNKLPWSGLAAWQAAERVPFQNPTSQNVAGFVQKSANFAYYQIMQAGHMVPLDQPWSAEYMFATIIGASTSTIPSTGLNKGPKAKLHSSRRRPRGL